LAAPKLSRLELQIMEVLWTFGPSPVREVQDHFPEDGRPAYTTIQTMISRLEAKKVVRKVKKIGSAHIFEAAVSRASAQRRLVDELVGLFGGRGQPVMAHMIEAGNLTMDDVREAERLLIELEEKRKGQRS
jgi:predicted transcriptional regulator